MCVFVFFLVSFLRAIAQELEKLTGTEADDGEEDISMMMLPDYSSGNNERDIHVKNFNINVGGLELLDCADLKLAYGRKVYNIPSNLRRRALLLHCCVVILLCSLARAPRSGTSFSLNVL